MKAFNRMLFIFAIVCLVVVPSHSFASCGQLSTHRSSLIQEGPPAVKPKLQNDRKNEYQRKRTTLLPAIPSTITIPENPAFIPIHILLTNILYLLRRSHIRGMPKRKLLQIRLTREPGVSLPLYATNIIAWQIFVTSIFPLLEPISRLFGYVSFYYFYPNASGLGE